MSYTQTPMWSKSFYSVNFGDVLFLFRQILTWRKISDIDLIVFSEAILLLSVS